MDRPTSKGVKSILKMKKLEYLTFIIKAGANVPHESTMKAEQHMFIQSLENLPNLKECIWSRGYFSGTDDVDFSSYLGKIYKKHLLDSFTLKLEKLYLHTSIGFSPRRMPAVKELHINDCGVECAREIATFANLKRLALANVSAKATNIILKKVGKNLEYLNITNEYLNTVSFFQLPATKCKIERMETNDNCLLLNTLNC
jgi:hypothetical protein